MSFASGHLALDLDVDTEIAEAVKKQADLQIQIQQMIEARSKEMESKFKNQYDDQIKQLQKKLDDSKKAAASTSGDSCTTSVAPTG